jgi:hypothetical protein
VCIKTNATYFLKQGKKKMGKKHYHWKEQEPKRMCIGRKITPKNAENNRKLP